jgi:hypothetical protein
MAAGEVERLLRNALFQLREVSIESCTHLGVLFEKPTHRGVEHAAVE